MTAHHPGDQHNTDHDHGEHDQVLAAWPLAQHDPGEHGDEQHLQIAEHCRHPGTDVSDRVIPQDEVDGQEHSSRHCRQPGG